MFKLFMIDAEGTEKLHSESATLHIASVVAAFTLRVDLRADKGVRQFAKRLRESPIGETLCHETSGYSFRVEGDDSEKSFREYVVADEVHDAIPHTDKKYAVLMSSKGSYTYGRSMEFYDGLPIALNVAQTAHRNGVEAIVVEMPTEKVVYSVGQESS